MKKLEGKIAIIAGGKSGIFMIALIRVKTDNAGYSYLSFIHMVIIS